MRREFRFARCMWIGCFRRVRGPDDDHDVHCEYYGSHSELAYLPSAAHLCWYVPSSPTCVTPAVTTEFVPSAISAGTSFTFTLPSTSGQTCWQYEIAN